MMNKTNLQPVHVIGGGLAGSEAAWQLAQNGIPVVLHEMRPHRKTNAHVSESLAELVCSNSFRSDDADFNAVGLLHQEMRCLGSLIMQSADANKVPAGGALAVDREAFAAAVQSAIEAEPLIEIQREEVDGPIPEEWDKVIIASGPLTSERLATTICELTGKNALFFFDAIAPIVHKDSIDFDKAWFQSRYDKGSGSDYINCPLNNDQYETFIDALLDGKKIEFKEWENTPYFESCLPIEVMAERGRKTLAFGPMKPVGLTNPNNPTVKPRGIIQLRQDNAHGTLWNMVGFQTKLTYSEQVRVFRTIPGLENAEFARLGGLHRNTFLNSPKLLNETLALKSQPHIRFAGQITGCEGYVESTAIGLLAGRFIAAERLGGSPSLPPDTTSIGALLSHITGGADEKNFQPMNVNFGLFPPIEGPEALNQKGKQLKGKDRKQAMSNRARRDFNNWLDTQSLTL
jgi:methylenetetrahydrofolate--tRNA-(uracil-5-)-methyltransferase